MLHAYMYIHIHTYIQPCSFCITLPVCIFWEDCFSHSQHSLVVCISLLGWGFVSSPSTLVWLPVPILSILCIGSHIGMTLWLCQIYFNSFLSLVYVSFDFVYCFLDCAEAFQLDYHLSFVVPAGFFFKLKKSLLRSFTKPLHIFF